MTRRSLSVSHPGGRPVTVSDKTITGAADLTVRQSILPLSLVTILFFLWGFAYGLLDVLNAHFQQVLDIKKSESAGLQGAYFGAYFITPLTLSGFILRRWGYKVTFITGLCIFATGCLLFWPSGINFSFAGFCGSMFVVGMGLSTLETSANPFIASCGPERYSEVRLNIAQSFQAIGTVVAPVLASYVFFKEANDKQSLKNVQWVYLGVAVFVLLLAVAFFFAPIPEITDADLQKQVEDISDKEVGPLRKQTTLLWGVMAQFCYVGAQVAIAGYFINYSLETGRSASLSSNLLAVAQGLFAIGRFAASGLMTFLRPRTVLTIFLGGCVVCSILAMNLKGTAGLVFLNLVLFFESCCFPTIFTLAIKKIGRHTKIGSTFLVSSISGGAVFPQILGQVADRRGTHFAMIVPFLGFVIAYTFPIYVNLRQKERMDYSPQKKVDRTEPENGFTGENQNKGKAAEEEEQRTREENDDSKQNVETVSLSSREQQK